MNSSAKIARSVLVLKALAISLFVAMVGPSVCRGATFSTNFTDPPYDQTNNDYGAPSSYTVPTFNPPLTVDFTNFLVSNDGDLAGVGGYDTTYSPSDPTYFSAGNCLWADDSISPHTYYLSFNQAVTGIILQACPSGAGSNQFSSTASLSTRATITGFKKDSHGTEVADTVHAYTFSISDDAATNGGLSEWYKITFNNGNASYDQIEFTNFQAMDLGYISVTPEPGVGISLFTCGAFLLGGRPARRKKAASV